MPRSYASAGMCNESFDAACLVREFSAAQECIVVRAHARTLKKVLGELKGEKGDVGSQSMSWRTWDDNQVYVKDGPVSERGWLKLAEGSP